MKHVQTARISIWNCKKSWVSCSSFCSVTSSKHIYIYTFITLILIILRPPGVADRGETAPWAVCLSAQKSSWDTFCASADLPGKSMARRNQEKTVDFCFTKFFFFLDLSVFSVRLQGIHVKELSPELHRTFQLAQSCKIHTKSEEKNTRSMIAKLWSVVKFTASSWLHHLPFPNHQDNVREIAKGELVAQITAQWCPLLLPSDPTMKNVLVA